MWYFSPNADILIDDIDFIPSKHLYTKLKTQMLAQLSIIDRAVLVVPHWETFVCDGIVRVPSTFEQLRMATVEGHAQPFHCSFPYLIKGTKGRSMSYHCKKGGSSNWTPGINATNYQRWYDDSSNGLGGFYRVKMPGPKTDKYYEPFTVVRRVEGNGFQLPRYQEKYVGRYKNKISFVTGLKTWRYQFFVIRNEFTLHMPHPVKKTEANDPAMLRHLEAMRLLHRQDRERGHKVIDLSLQHGRSLTIM